jgi:hypothetical protein
MSGQQAKRARQPKPENATGGSFKDFLEESKVPRFAPRRKGDRSKDKQVAADGISAEEGLRDEVLDHDLITKRKISAETAEDYGIDQKAAELALRYAAALQEATKNILTATPDETKRLNDAARERKLELELHHRLQAAKELPPRFTDDRQSDLAGQVVGTSYELKKLQKARGADDVAATTDDLVTKVSRSRSAYRYAKLKEETEKPTKTIKRRTSRERHLAA